MKEEVSRNRMRESDLGELYILSNECGLYLVFLLEQSIQYYLVTILDNLLCWVELQANLVSARPLSGNDDENILEFQLEVEVALLKRTVIEEVTTTVIDVAHKLQLMSSLEKMATYAMFFWTKQNSTNWICLNEFSLINSVLFQGGSPRSPNQLWMPGKKNSLTP